MKNGVGLFDSVTRFWFHFGFKEKTDMTLMCQYEFVALFYHITHDLIFLLRFFLSSKLFIILLKDFIHLATYYFLSFKYFNIDPY